MIEQFLPFSLHEIQRLQKESKIENKRCFFVGGYEPIRAEILKILTPELENSGYKQIFICWINTIIMIAIRTTVKIKGLATSKTLRR
jgi:hypothetical protein